MAAVNIRDVKLPRLCAGAVVTARRFPRLCGDRAARRAAGRIPQSWTPCGTVVAIAPSQPSGGGPGHISVGPWVLVNIIGRWCGKLTVLASDPKATLRIKLRDLKLFFFKYSEE